jgi:hypothetical protein
VLGGRLGGHGWGVKPSKFNKIQFSDFAGETFRVLREQTLGSAKLFFKIILIM